MATKAELYLYIKGLRNKLEIESKDYPIYLPELYKKTGTQIEFLPFKTNGIRGMAWPATDGPACIMIKQRLTRGGRNYVCGHEIIHLELHQKKKMQSFKCYDKVQPGQDNYIEWQANEGSAELIMPYKMFIPKVIECAYTYHNITEEYFLNEIPNELAEWFMVSPTIARQRLYGLKYEIAMYCAGCDIDSIVPLSARQQREKGITADRNRFIDLLHFRELSFSV